VAALIAGVRQCQLIESFGLVGTEELNLSARWRRLQALALSIMPSPSLAAMRHV